MLSIFFPKKIYITAGIINSEECLYWKEWGEINTAVGENSNCTPTQKEFFKWHNENHLSGNKPKKDVQELNEKNFKVTEQCYAPGHNHVNPPQRESMKAQQIPRGFFTAFDKVILKYII